MIEMLLLHDKVCSEYEIDTAPSALLEPQITRFVSLILI